MRAKRAIIRIDEEKCDGCGLCIPACPEGALQIVDGKAKLVKEGFCDGLGACLGDCPQDALTIEEKVTDEYDEEGVIKHLKQTAPDRLDDHLRHLREHAVGPHGPSPESAGGASAGPTACSLGGFSAGASGLSEAGPSQLPEGGPHQASKPRAPQCPSSRLMRWEDEGGGSGQSAGTKSELRQWPIQLHLVSPIAPYFKSCDLALIADCVPFSYANFHNDFMRGKAIAIACPKLDDVTNYVEKLSQIITTGGVRSVKVVIMEVPCCSGLVRIAQEALGRAKVSIPFEVVVVGIKGAVLKTA